MSIDSCCFRNASYKTVISKISFILFCFGYRNGRKYVHVCVCVCIYLDFSYASFTYCFFWVSYRKYCFDKIVFKSELPWQWKPEAYQHTCCRVNGAADAGLSFIPRSAPPHEKCINICDLWVSLLQWVQRRITLRKNRLWRGGCARIHCTCLFGAQKVIQRSTRGGGKRGYEFLQQICTESEHLSQRKASCFYSPPKPL